MLIGTSLKMYFSHARTLAWLEEVVNVLRHRPGLAEGVTPFLIPQYPSIPDCVRIGTPADIAIGAQDVATADAGAYTGEVSAAVLTELGCRFVEVGHAERRRLFGETDEVVAAKVHAAHRNGLVPLLCVGEQEAGDPAQAVDEVLRQVERGLSRSREEGQSGRTVIAYEPVWAIGAPEPAGPEHIRAVCGPLREYAASADEDISVIYGGSAGPGLLGSIRDSVDGLFLGRFVHDPRAFIDILEEAATLVAEEGS